MQAKTPGGSAVTALLATHEFFARFDDELSLVPGESIIGIRREAGWWHGQNRAGKRGIFPENFVEVAPAPPPPPTAPPVQADGPPGAMSAVRTRSTATFGTSVATPSTLKRELFELSAAPRAAAAPAAAPAATAGNSTAALEARLAASAARARADLLRSAVERSQTSPGETAPRARSFAAEASLRRDAAARGSGVAARATTGLAWADRLMQMEASVAGEGAGAGAGASAAAASAAPSSWRQEASALSPQQLASALSPAVAPAAAVAPAPQLRTPARAAPQPSPPMHASPLQEEEWAVVAKTDKERVLASLLAQAKAALEERESELARANARLSDANAAVFRREEADGDARLAAAPDSRGDPRTDELERRVGELWQRVGAVERERDELAERLAALRASSSASGAAVAHAMPGDVLARAAARADEAESALAAERGAAHAVRDELRRVAVLEREARGAVDAAHKLAATRLAIVEQMQVERSELDAQLAALREAGCVLQTCTLFSA